MTLWGDGCSGHEQGCFAGNRQTLWAGGGLPCLAHRPLWHLSPPHAAVLGTATAWADGRVVGCRVGRSDQGRARRQPVPWRGPSQGLGAVALRRHTDLVAPGASLMREHDLLAPGRVGSPRGPRSHDGTIVPDTIDTMWGTDLTATFTGEGPAAVFITVDHCSAECVGIHAHARATRFEALEPIRQGVRRYFGGFAANVAHGLAVRHDHGSQYMSDHFQREIAFIGIESSPAFVRAPEGNGCAE